GTPAEHRARNPAKPRPRRAPRHGATTPCRGRRAPDRSYPLDSEPSFILNAGSRDRRWNGLGWNTNGSAGFDPGIKAGTAHRMKNGQHMGPRLFGDGASIGVQRGLAELRAGRPVRIEAAGVPVLALPVDGCDDGRLAAFRALVHPASPRLVVTARRARALGVEAARPVLLEL